MDYYYTLPLNMLLLSESCMFLSTGRSGIDSFLNGIVEPTSGRAVEVSYCVPTLWSSTSRTGISPTSSPYTLNASRNAFYIASISRHVSSYANWKSSGSTLFLGLGNTDPSYRVECPEPTCTLLMCASGARRWLYYASVAYGDS